VVTGARQPAGEAARASPTARCDLCRLRHKTHYAEVRIMPMLA
jgi:hypothetical protein